MTWERDGDELVLIGAPPASDREATRQMLAHPDRQVVDLARGSALKAAELETTLTQVRGAATEADPQVR